MNIVSKALPKMTPVEIRKCKRLTFGQYGYMHPCLVEHQQNPRARAIMAWDGDQLLGWALLIPTKEVDNDYFPTSAYGRKTTKFAAQYYVRQKSRKMGVGTALMKRTRRFDKRPFVWPHDTPSGELFKRFPVTTTRHSRKEYLGKVPA